MLPGLFLCQNLGYVVLKAWARLEYDFVVAPSLKLPDFFGRVGLVIHHDIWIVVQIPERIYPK